MIAATKAQYVQMLVYYDEPQLLLLRSNRHMSVIAVAIDYPKYEHPFFACEVYKKDLEKYKFGKADLYYLFRVAAGQNYYLFDLDSMVDKTVTLKHLQPSQISPEWFPDRGFFSRSHTHFSKDETSEKQIIRSFAIDGDWDADEFSAFYGKVSDLYAFLHLTNDLEQGLVPAKDWETTIRYVANRFWQGGGSYVGFYGDISTRAQRRVPLKVQSIQYASPGQIELRGDASLFQQIEETIFAFDTGAAQMQELYSDLNEILTRAKLRKAPPTAKFRSQKHAEEVRDKTMKLAQKMLLDGDELFKVADKNILVFCKLILSFFRRAKVLYEFHVEGRARIRPAGM